MKFQHLRAADAAPVQPFAPFHAFDAAAVNMARLPETFR